MARYYSTTETAKLVRAALKATFPGVKFSVRSKKYSGGSSIRVTWKDGPTTDAVRSVAGRFEGATFDGMIDLKSYVTSLVSLPDGSVEEVHYGADYVFCDREFSPEVEASGEAAIRAWFGNGAFEALGVYDRAAAVRRYLSRCRVVNGVLLPGDTATAFEGVLR